jgi:L-alanine-DL-glutamate epimerase-like enolase superfamily enzyme
MKVADWVIHAPDQRFHVLLELKTDTGVSGWGAAYSERGQVLGAFAWLKRFVMGENPLEPERITEKLHQVTFWVGRGGAMTHAISAINIALWDLAGRTLGQPVSVLLGGRQHRRVLAYGSVLFTPVDTLAARIDAMRARGFRAIKLGWSPFGRQALSDDETLVRRARQAAGADTQLMIDAGGSAPFWPLRLKQALERARMLAAYDVQWFEEPLAPDDLEGYARLTDQSPIRIAHGEVLTRRQTFLPYFARRAMDIVQPDACKVGGLSEMRRLAWAAEGHGIDLVPHGWNTAVGVAADLQLGATLPSVPLVEFNVGNRLVEELCHPTFSLDADGCIRVPDGPGLGIEIDVERLHVIAEGGYASETWTWDEARTFEAHARDSE